MITRILLAGIMFASLAFAAEQARKSDICFTIPENWEQEVDPDSHLLSLVAPGTGAVVTFTESGSYAGTAEAFQNEAWEGVLRSLKIKTPATPGRCGEFLTMSAVFAKPDGTELWIRAYSAVHNGRSENVIFFARNGALYRTHLATADHMVEGFTFAPPGNETAAPPAGPPAAALPAELSVGAPPGWAAQQDPATRVVYMKPPNAPSVREAALVVFPAIDFSGTAEQFHQQTLANAVGQRRFVQPVQKGRAGGFMASAAHAATAQGAEVWLVLYTARWGSRAQAVLWAADRQDLFTANGPSVLATLKQVTVPEAGTPPQVESANPAQSANGPGTNPSTAPPAAATAAGGGVDAGDSMPVLEYTDPPNFWRGGAGGKSYAEYQGREVNFVLCVYPFREFQGDIRATFQQTMLRDWIDVMYREESVAGAPRVVANTVPGADTVIDAHFADNRNQEHHRLIIISGHWAAIVDMIAPTAFAYQKAFPSALEMLKSMHVGRKQAPPSLAQGPGPAGAQLAGLFQGMKGKFTVNLMLGPGYGGTQTALHYFLLSADGRVYRCYDFPPGGSEGAARNFDFDAAARQDPQNSGRYAVRGNELYIRFGGPNIDEITTTVVDPNTLQLDGVTYQRKF